MELHPIDASEIMLDTLIPLTILEGKSKNPFQKYGLEFEGNCYSCDLANIKINTNKITL